MLSRRMCFTLILPWLLVAPMLGAGSASAASSERHQRQARAFVENALVHIQHNNIDGRRSAISELEQATQLEPENADYQLLLARCYYAAGYVRASSKCFERVVSLAPEDAMGHLGLGQVWRRDWLKFLDTLSLQRSIGELHEAARLDSNLVEAWLLLSSMRIEAHDTLGAAAAAASAFTAKPGQPETELAVAATQWRLGNVAEADAHFRHAIPRMPQNVRDCYNDIAPLASEKDTMLYNHLPPAAHAEFARRFWVEHDPDLTTPENEAQLEYWSRVTQAYFLYYNQKHKEWDERGELYVRYGPPEKLDYNPLGAYLYSKVGDSRMRYAMNVLVWNWPSLGMSVSLQDRVLSEYYLLPYSADRDPDPRPDPDSLLARGVLGTHDSRGVFPMLPPRTVSVPVRGQVARFEGPAQPRYYAALEAESAPGDSLRAQFVVMDSTGHELYRTLRPLAPSACEADRYRVADFAGALPPGEYRVGLSVRAGARRGNVRLALSVPKPDSVLSLSDVVITCGSPLVMGAAVRLDPNPLARVPAGEPLTAYFEIYRLEAGRNGDGRFEYVYTVKSLQRDPRIWLQRALSPRSPSPSVEVSRVEDYVGGIRRQFVSIPSQSLPPPGRYRLEIVVHDLVSGEETRGHADFERLAARN